MKIVGLDLSLTSTGVAGNGWTDRITGGDLRDHMRLEFIAAKVLTFTRGADLVVIEGPSYGSKGGSAHERAGLWWLVTHKLWNARVPLAVVPPHNLKLYATGTTKSDKDDVVRTATRRFDWFEGKNDEADALWLAAMGHDRLGVPLVAMPQAHRAALTKCQWPALMSESA